MKIREIVISVLHLFAANQMSMSMSMLLLNDEEDDAGYVCLFGVESKHVIYFAQQGSKRRMHQSGVSASTARGWKTSGRWP